MSILAIFCRLYLLIFGSDIIFHAHYRLQACSKNYSGLFPFTAQMLDCTQNICSNELVGLLQQNKYKSVIIIHR